MAIEIIGFCRFSFFGPSDTKLSYDDRQQAFDTLFAPERMEIRFGLFENLFLPAIKAQTDQDFKLVILASACMPAPFKDRLTKACAPIPQIELLFAEGEHLGAELRPYSTTQHDPGTGLLQFRIDDDDALSRNYIANLRKWAPRMRHESILTMPFGLMLFHSPDGPKLHPMYRNLTGAGFAYFTEGRTRKNVFGFAHLNAGRRFPFLSDPSIFSYIQTFTSSSDTAFRSHRKIKQFMRNAGVPADSKHAGGMIERAMTEDFAAFDQQRLLSLLQSLDVAPPATADAD